MGLVLLCVGLTGYAVYMHERQLAVAPASYEPLLELIGQAESKGNYNAYFGAPHSTSPRFTDMTIRQVRDWQRAYIAHGAASSAVGKYQIIDTTLDGLVTRLKLSPDTKFDHATQDALAVALIERRGSIDYINKQLSQSQLAANLAQEWASLPRITGSQPESSYYAGDGLNASLVHSQQVLHAVAQLKPQ